MNPAAKGFRSDLLYLLVCEINSPAINCIECILAFLPCLSLQTRDPLSWLLLLAAYGEAKRVQASSYREVHGISLEI